MSSEAASREIGMRTRQTRRPAARHLPRAMRRAAIVVGALALGGLVVLALSHLGFSRLGNSLVSVDPWWLLLALVLDGISLALRGISWQAVLHAALPDLDIGLARVIRATMIGVFVSAIVPGRIGEPARAWLVARRAGQPRRSFPIVLGTVFSQTLLNLLALAILAGVTFASVALFRGHESALVLAVAIPGGIAALVLAGPRALDSATRSRWARMRSAASWVQREVSEVRRGLTVFRDGRRGFVAAFFQLAAWGVQTLAVYAVIVSLHLQGQANLGAAAAILLAVNVTAVVPVTPSNLGVFQAACIAVLAAYGVGPGRGLAFGILLQAVEVVAAVALGAPALLREGVSWRELRRRVPPVAPAEEAAPPRRDPDRPA
jgi:phosphatidyl-myo-inositol alpha-mannosyltransferase